MICIFELVGEETSRKTSVVLTDIFVSGTDWESSSLGSRVCHKDWTM